MAVETGARANRAGTTVADGAAGVDGKSCVELRVDGVRATCPCPETVEAQPASASSAPPATSPSRGDLTRGA
jgi:hypothetical protein